MQTSFVTKVDGIQFDVHALTEAYRSLAARIQPAVATRGDDRLRSISLTHRPSAREPLYDGNQSQFDQCDKISYSEHDFTVFNTNLRDTYFYEIYQKVPFPVGRMRVMVLPALTIYGTHSDATMRAHIAIITNPDCRIVLRTGETVHIPVDGHVYVVNTKQPHTAYNSGSAERIHLTMSMAATEDR